jgi:mRNA interferase RelE/StbE
VDKFEVILVSAALKFYRHCPAGLSERLNRCFEALESNPFFGPNIKRLRDEEKRYRYRIGDYRVIYAVDKEARKVIVTLIAPRSSVYRGF